jgi:hypothetical protein
MCSVSWRRPYRRGWIQVVFTVLLLCGLGVVAGLIADGSSKASTQPGRAAVELLIAVIFGVVLFGFLGRLAFIGIYVSDKELRYHGFVRTVTVPWTSVKGVRLAPLRFRWVSNLGGARTIWIYRVNEPPVQTWVNDKGVGFLSRQKAFDRAFLAIKGELEAYRDGVGSRSYRTPTPCPVHERAYRAPSRRSGPDTTTPNIA